MNIITLFACCMIISGMANAGCLVSSGEHDFGGRSIGNGSCLTLANVSAALELYGNSVIIYLNKFCEENFKQRRLLRFINPKDLHVLSHANFKRHSTFNILLHPGVRLIHEDVYERVEAVFIEKCNKSELLNCKVVRHFYISDINKPMEGRLYKCKEDRCCTGIDCSVVPPLSIYESPLVANVSIISGGTYCRCLSLDQQLLKSNLSNEVVYDCNAMPCDVFACLHDEYADCIDRKVPKVGAYSVETKSCTQRSIDRISEKETPYGLDCKERDFGEPCSFPCVGTWSPWSTPSTACGNVTSLRYLPNLATIAENKTCSGVAAPCCKITQSTVVSCNDASTNRDGEEFKLKCEQNGGSVNMPRTELLYTYKTLLKNNSYCENHERNRFKSSNRTICLCFGLNRKKKMIDNMVFDEFLHSPLLQNNNFVRKLNDSNYLERVCLKEEKDYAEFKKEAVNFCSDWLKENRFVQNYGSFVGDALTLCTHTVYICISIAGESSWIACDCSPESLFAHAKFDW
ncbi:hypothetical protein T4B_6281, partial [Trichinella pseudospiralis]